MVHSSHTGAGGKKLSSVLAVSPETVVWQLVKFFARQEDAGRASREGRSVFEIPLTLELETKKRTFSKFEVSQSRRRPALGPSPG